MAVAIYTEWEPWAGAAAGGVTGIGAGPIIQWAINATINIVALCLILAAIVGVIYVMYQLLEVA